MTGYSKVDPYLNQHLTKYQTGARPMKENQLDAAMNMVVTEFDKLAMCKRGTIETDINTRDNALDELEKDLPYLSRKQRASAITGIRKKLQASLKLKKSHDLVAAGNISKDYQVAAFTSESIAEYNRILKGAIVHPKFAEVQAFNDDLEKKSEILSEEKRARLAMLDDDLKDLKMGFLTGSLKLTTLTTELASFEAGVY